MQKLIEKEIERVLALMAELKAPAQAPLLRELSLTVESLTSSLKKLER